MFEGGLPFFSSSTLEIGSKLATPIIATVVAIVAYLQWSTNKALLKEKLFERRFQVFRETQSFLSEILSNADFSDESLWKFTDTCQRSRFFFGKATHDYLMTIRERAAKMKMYNAIYADLGVGDERSKNVDLEHVELAWLNDQLPLIFDHFEPYLGFGKNK